MNNMDIQREAVIEVVGTQYEGRVSHHRDLSIHQRVILKRDKGNRYDSNAILVLTEDQKDLGFLPRGQASLYAPAMDSGKYSFSAEIVKAEHDATRPVLLIRIIAERTEVNEEDVHQQILNLVQYIISCNTLIKTEYLQFIDNESVNVQDLLSVLNQARLFAKLGALSADFVQEECITATVMRVSFHSKDELLNRIKSLQPDITEVLKRIQKTYNEMLDIEDEDEEEYYKAQTELRKKRKYYRSLDTLCESFCKAIEEYEDIECNVNTAETPKANHLILQSPSDTETPMKAEIAHSNQSIPITLPKVEFYPPYSERAFEVWLTNDEGLSASTANVYISALHSIEKLYQSIWHSPIRLFDDISLKEAKEAVFALPKHKDYIDANSRRHNMFQISLTKYAKFMGLPEPDLLQESLPETKAPKPESTIQKMIAHLNPKNCTSTKPRLFTFSGESYRVDSWRELYRKLLILLYSDTEYAKTLHQQCQKPLYGKTIDFADQFHTRNLRQALRISDDFYVEGNLSSSDIIKHIIRLIALCGIPEDNLQVEFDSIDMSEKQEQEVQSETTDSLESKQLTAKLVPELTKQDTTTSANAVPEQLTPTISITTSLPPLSPKTVPSVFQPDLSKPFVLKDAVIAILSSEDPLIKQKRTYRNGLSSQSIQEFIRTYYKRTVGFFDISKMLMTNHAFLSVGKGRYALNAAPEKENQHESAEQLRAVQEQIAPAESPEPAQNHESLADRIIEVIRNSSSNLEYTDGFGSYEVKMLLAKSGLNNVTEDEIETAMQSSKLLKEVDPGYYILIGKQESKPTLPPEIKPAVQKPKPIELQTHTEERVFGVISLKINGRPVDVQDCNAALNRALEFAIRCRAFKMARIPELNTCYNGKPVFCRSAAPMIGYHRLSNYMLVMDIAENEALCAIIRQVKDFCQIGDDLISITMK